MIQDIAPHVYHNEYRPKKPSRDSYGMSFEGGKIRVIMRGDEIDFPTFADLEEKNPHIYEDYIYLFEIDDRQFYLLKNVAMDQAYKLFTRRDLREKDPQYLSFAGVTAFQLYGWYENNRFCGKCGTLMKHDEKLKKYIPTLSEDLVKSVIKSVGMRVKSKEITEFIMNGYKLIEK